MGSPSQPESNKALLPGVGRPLDYIPDRTAPDYVGDLFKNALSAEDIWAVSEGFRLHHNSKRPGPYVAYVAYTTSTIDIVLTPCDTEARRLRPSENWICYVS